MKKVFFICTSICIVLLTIVLYKVAVADTSTNIPTRPEEDEYPATNPFDIRRCVTKTDSSETPLLFAASLYLDSANYQQAAAVRSDLDKLDSLHPDKSYNRRKLSDILTGELATRTNHHWNTYQPDSLLLLLQWAEQFRYFASADPESRTFYKSVYSYWLNFISDKLTRYSNDRPSLKYDFKFKYLVARCREQHYTMSIKVSSWEKFVENILYSNWGHLINATWNQSSAAIKAGLLLFILIFLYGGYTIIKQIVNRLNVKK